MILTKTLRAPLTPPAYGLERLTPPALEPVTVSEARNHLRIDNTNTQDDALIASLITTARQCAEQWLSRSLITQTWRLFLDHVPTENIIELPRPPLISIEHIKSHNDADEETIFPAEAYLVDTARQPGRIILRSGASWPDPTRSANALEIQFSAGYGTTAEDVPAAIRQGILIHVASLFSDRGDGLAADGQPNRSANKLNTPPANAYALYAPYRLLGL